MFKRENTKIISLIVLGLLFIFGAYFSFSHTQTEKSVLPIAENQDIQQAKEIPKIEITTAKTKENSAILEINGVKYQSEIREGTGVYDLMDKLRSEEKINFKDKTYLGMGKFIEEINGIRGDGTRYWVYYVNGKKAMVGVSNYKINPGDVVSWRYEKETY